MEPQPQSGTATAAIDLAFPHRWRAELLKARPAILPARHYVYPRDVEEVERGALELMIEPAVGQPFLATCALGFRDLSMPTGLWSAPNPRELCAVAGGYAYILDTEAPERFIMIAFRPVFTVRPVVDAGLLLFVGSRSILAWGSEGLAWESEKLSDEGVAVTSIDATRLCGTGWELIADRETPFVLDLRTGRRAS